MQVARKIAYNVVVSTVSKLLSTALALLSIGLITRYLGKDGFGNYATVLAFLSFFSAIGDLGLYSISTREISRPGADQEKIIGNVMSLRIIVSLVIAVLSPVVVFFFPYSHEVKAGIIIIAVSFLFSSSYQILNGVFQKNLAMDKVAISELIGKGIQVLGIVVAVKLGLGFNWITGSLLFCMAASFIMVYLWSRKFIRIRLALDFSLIFKLLRQSYVLGIAAVITFVYFKVDTIMLSLMKSSADVGIYNAAYKVLENLSFFPAMIVGLIFPLMSRYVFTQRKKFEDISNKTFKVFVLIIIPLVVGTLFLAEGIVWAIGGGGFSESAAVLRILVFAVACIFFGNFFNAVLISSNLQKKLMIVMIIAAVFNVTANLIFIPRYSYMAAAWISTITELMVASGTFFYVAYKTKYYPRLENAGGVLASGLVMALVLFGLRNTNFIIAGVLGLSVYVVFLWIFRAVKTEEITSIISKRGVKEYESLP